MIKETAHTHTHATHMQALDTMLRTYLWSIHLMEIGLDVALVITGKWRVVLSSQRSHCPHWHVVCLLENCMCVPLVCMLCALHIMSV